MNGVRSDCYIYPQDAKTDNMIDFGRFTRVCEAAVDAADFETIVEALRRAVTKPERLHSELPSFDGDETLLYSSTNLTIVHLRLTPNAHYPPHNHNMPAIVGIYAGREHNQRYRITGDRLSTISSNEFSAGSVYVLPRDTIHSVANPDEEYSYGLHVYAGDLVNQERSIWDPDTFVSHPYSDERYFSFCRAFDCTRPFEAPAVCYAHAQKE